MESSQQREFFLPAAGQNDVKPQNILAFALSLSVTLSELPAQGQSDQTVGGRLVVAGDQGGISTMELQGVVRTRNKYSIVVESGSQQYLVRFTRSTRVMLKLASPRIFFDKQQLITRVEGDPKQFRAFEFQTPLYLRTEFDHRNQYRRVMAMPVKRLSNYVLSNELPASPRNEGEWMVTGKLTAGLTNRQIKLETGETVYDVILAKRGRLTGFSIAELLADKTAVRIQAATVGDQIDAREILFWPIADTDRRPDEG